MLVRVLLVAVRLAAVPLVAVTAGCGSGRTGPAGTATVVSAAVRAGSGDVAAGPGDVAAGPDGTVTASPLRHPRSAAETACLATTREQVAVGRRAFLPGVNGDDASAYARASREAWIACAALTVTRAREIRDEAERDQVSASG